MTQRPNSFAGTALSCSRGDALLFSDLAFSLESGQWLHVRGRNGAGKTSLLRILAGLSNPDSGSVRWNGADIRKRSDGYREALLYIGHPAGLKADLTPLENLRIAASLDGSAFDEVSSCAALERLGLGGREDMLVKTLSQGQKRRALLARLLVRPARLWILDEPYTALDDRAGEAVNDIIIEHLSAGGIAVLTSHQPVPIVGAQELQV